MQPVVGNGGNGFRDPAPRQKYFLLLPGETTALRLVTNQLGKRYVPPQNMPKMPLHGCR
jgi:hypothetical protein